MKDIAKNVEEVCNQISARVTDDIKDLSELEILDYLVSELVAFVVKSTLAADELLEKGEPFAGAISAVQTSSLKATILPVVLRLTELD